MSAVNWEISKAENVYVYAPGRAVDSCCVRVDFESAVLVGEMNSIAIFTYKHVRVSSSSFYTIIAYYLYIYMYTFKTHL